MTQKIGKAVTVAVLLTFLCGVFGCGKTLSYTPEELVSISATCGHMDYSFSYSFFLRKEGDDWFFDADFATDSEHPHTVFEARPVSDEDVKELLSPTVWRELSEKMSRRERPNTKIRISDETSYYTSIRFSDGKTYGRASSVSRELEANFYRLAEKYADKISE